MKKMTIGVISDWAESLYHKSLLSGITARAKKHDINLITYLGGALNSPIRWEYERNIIYNFVNRDVVKGLIILSGSMGRYCSADEMKAFCTGFSPIPVISLSQHYPDIHSILIDNHSGIEGLMTHFIRDHGYSKIACIAGPEPNQEARIRLEAYKTALEDHGLPYRPEYVIPGNFTIQSGHDAARILLRKFNLQLDAVLALNDDMAQGAMAAFQKMGLDIPRDLAIAGFDDQDKSKYFNPALTTVAQPLVRQGKKAVDSLLRLCDGKPLPLRHYLPSQLIIRESCGCLSGLAKNTGEGSAESPRDAAVFFTLKNSWQKIEREFSRKLGVYSRTIGKELKDTQQNRLFTAFKAALILRKKEIFIEGLNSILDETEDKIFIENLLSKTVAFLAEAVEKNINSQGDLLFLKELCYFAQKNINIHIIRFYKAFLVKIEEVHQIIHYTSGEAMNISSLEAILHLLAEKLPQLDIKNFLFTFYEKLNREEPAKSISRLALAYMDNRRIPLPGKGIVFSSSKLFPQNLIKSHKSFAYVVEPLFFGPIHFGVAILEADTQLDSILNTMFRWFLNSIIIVELFVIHMQQQKTDIEAQMVARTGELKFVNRKLSETIGQLKETQGTLLRQAKMASLGRLTSGIAHELKNPLNFINNFARINLEDTTELADILARYHSVFSPEDRERMEELLEDIEDNSREVVQHGSYADRIIKSMLNQARGENKIIESCHVNAILKEIVILAYHSQRSIAPGFDISIEENYDDNIPPLRANRTDLSKVFLNFIDNAFYALNSRGKEERDFKPVLRLHTSYDGEEITIRFKDNGAGIEEEVLDHIFDPFFTTKPAGEGTGIGLKTCYEIIVEGMGGELSCESGKGKDTTFTIRLKATGEET